MIKQLLLLSICIVGFISCKKEDGINSNNGGYTITINAELTDDTKAYLHKFNTGDVQKIDSTTFINHTTTFTGQIVYPERYLITIDEVFGGLVLIVENDSISIVVKNKDLINAQITGSQLNKELQIYKANLDKIYSKVDALFPEMQRARLENNADKLKNISSKMQGIETESIEYSFEYASEKLDSYISAIILNDLSMRDSIDLSRITTLYKKIAVKVKESPDAKELNAFLNSYK